MCATSKNLEINGANILFLFRNYFSLNRADWFVDLQFTACKKITAVYIQNCPKLFMGYVLIRNLYRKFEKKVIARIQFEQKKKTLWEPCSFKGALIAVQKFTFKQYCNFLPGIKAVREHICRRCAISKRKLRKFIPVFQRKGGET